MRHNRAIGFVVQVRMRSSENISLNQLFPRCYGVLGSAIDNWVWYRRIGGGRGCSRLGQQSPGGIEKGCRRNILGHIKRNWCSAHKKN
jgi:hypothetical protein